MKATIMDHHAYATSKNNEDSPPHQLPIASTSLPKYMSNYCLFTSSSCTAVMPSILLSVILFIFIALLARNEELNEASLSTGNEELKETPCSARHEDTNEAAQFAHCEDFKEATRKNKKKRKEIKLKERGKGKKKEQRKADMTENQTKTMSLWIRAFVMQMIYFYYFIAAMHEVKVQQTETRKMADCIYDDLSRLPMMAAMHIVLIALLFLVIMDALYWSHREAAKVSATKRKFDILSKQKVAIAAGSEYKMTRRVIREKVDYMEADEDDVQHDYIHYSSNDEMRLNRLEIVKIPASFISKLILIYADRLKEEEPHQEDEKKKEKVEECFEVFTSEPSPTMGFEQSSRAALIIAITLDIFKCFISSLWFMLMKMLFFIFWDIWICRMQQS